MKQTQLQLKGLINIICSLVLISLTQIRVGYSEDYFIQHPVSQSVIINSTFTLTCRFRVSIFQETPAGYPKTTVQWVRNKFGLGATREDIQEAGMEPNSAFSRYDLPNDLNEGQYDLQIRYAKSTDEGKYVCQLHHGGKTYFSQTADIRVLVASESPELVQSDVSSPDYMKRVGPLVAATAVEGGYLRLHCIARNGKPGAKLFWSLNGSPLSISYNNDGTRGQILSPIEGNVSIKGIPTLKPPFLMTTVSEVIVYVTKLHHGLKIQCNAQNEGYEHFSPQPTFTKFNILYAPVVQIRTLPTTGRRKMVENDIVTIRCSAEGRPDNFTWSWKLNGSTLKGESSDHYRIRLTRELINATVSCSATTFAEGSAQTVLSFFYAPHFSNPNAIIYAGSVGDPFRMHCFADGNPRPEIEWRVAGTNGPGTVLMRDEYFVRDKIHPNDFGTYICTARSVGYPPVSKKLILAKKTAPTIKPTQAVYAAIGSAARLTCTINAVPLPPTEGLLWFRRDIILRPSSHRKFLTQEFLGGVVYIMSINYVMSTDYGFYNCSAVNAYGSAWQTIELRRDDELSISSLSGILAALVVFVVLGLLIFFCRRRRQNRESLTKGNEVSNTTNKLTSETFNSPYGYIHKNHFPQMMASDSKEEAFSRQSSSGSTDAESFNRYQFPSTTIGTSTVLGCPSNRTPSRGPSTGVPNECLSLRPFSPACKYALVDSRGQHIPICTNIVSFANHPVDSQLTNDDSGALRCIASDYSPIHISCLNQSLTSDTDEPRLQCIGLMPATPIPPDSDIIVNTQVTNV